VVTDRNGSDARANFFDDGTALVPQDGGKNAFGIFARERERIGVADASRDISEQDLAGLGSLQVEHFDFERFACFPGNGSACLH